MDVKQCFHDETLNFILNTKNAVEGRVLPITVVKLKPLKGKFERTCPASFVCEGGFKIY